MKLGPKERPQSMEISPIAGAGPIGAIVFGVALVAQLLGGLFGLFGGGDAASMTDLNKLRNDTAAAIDTTYRFAWFVAFALGSLLKAVDFMWNSVIKQILGTLVKLAKRVMDLVTRVITPILTALNRIQKILNEIYDKFLRPVLNVISIVRRYLQILKALHVPFADKLDKILANVQGKIIGPFLWVLRTLNGYGRWINLILTAGGVLQRPIALNSHYAYQRDWVGMFWNSQTSTMRGGPAYGAVVQPARPDANQVAADFADLARSGGGAFAAAADKSELTFRDIVSV